MKNTKVKYNNVNEYFESLSKPSKKAFVVGIKYALKIMRANEENKSAMNEMMSLLAK